MRTYQDLLKAGSSDRERGEFCKEAVDKFKLEPSYKEAEAGEAYYNKHNVTIENFKKFITTMSGRKVEDTFSANYKLKSLVFRRFITQITQYMLANGIKFKDQMNKEKLGKDFEFKVLQATKKAMTQGQSFGFWNLDHIEVFGYCETASQPGFCPLYCEETGKLMAGIRFWNRTIGDKKTFRCTLYEADGYTEFTKVGSEPIVITAAKRGYIRTVVATLAEGVQLETFSNYGPLPIVPMYANDTHESELVGIRESIDCYDYIKSGFANDIDDTPGIYWAIKNAGGMDNADLAEFVQRMAILKAGVLEDGVDVEAHTLEVPVEARKTLLETLRADLYEDFQMLDVKTLTASAKTTQEIQAAYQAQDNKCSELEYFLYDFLDGIFALAGIDDEVTFTYNKIINVTEQTNMVLNAANYLSDEMVIKHLPFLTPEEIEEEIAKLETRNVEQFNDDEEGFDGELGDE